VSTTAILGRPRDVGRRRLELTHHRLLELTADLEKVLVREGEQLLDVVAAILGY
jgi:hypothetical protein